MCPGTHSARFRDPKSARTVPVSVPTQNAAPRDDKAPLPRGCGKKPLPEHPMKNHEIFDKGSYMFIGRTWCGKRITRTAENEPWTTVERKAIAGNAENCGNCRIAKATNRAWGQPRPKKNGKQHEVQPGHNGEGLTWCARRVYRRTRRKTAADKRRGPRPSDTTAELPSHGHSSQDRQPRRERTAAASASPQKPPTNAGGRQQPTRAGDHGRATQPRKGTRHRLMRAGTQPTSKLLQKHRRKRKPEAT